jgi:hypothetical protein
MVLGMSQPTITPTAPTTSITNAVGLPRLMPKHARRQRDHCSLANARELALKLTEWWHAKGHTNVVFWVVAQPVRTSKRASPVWVVRSNLINGAPPKPETTRKPITPSVDHSVPPLSTAVPAERDA